MSSTGSTGTGKSDLKTQVLDFARARWADFRGFSPGQKAVTIVAVVALAVGGYLLATWKSDPAYAPMYSNLAGSDASSIVGKLEEKGIPYKLTDGGSAIAVPTDKVDSARLAVSAAGLPNSGQTGYALLDKEGVTTSQFKQQVDYQRAVEGELARTIQSIDGVQAAAVHLAIPKDDVFSDGTEKPTAAVLLTVAPGTTLTSSQVQSVVYLVSSSVTGMKTGNVTVSDSDGTVLSAPDGGLTGAVNADTQAKTVQDYNARLAASIQAAIDSSLGPGHAKVVVNASLDFNRSTTKQNKYIYDRKNPPVSETTTKEKYTGTKGAGGPLGTVDTSGGTGASGQGGYSKTDRTVNNSLGTISTTTQSAPGQLKNLHIAVMLDKKAKGVNVGAISSVVKSGVGFDAARGDSLSVQAVPFDTSAHDAAVASAKKAAADAAAAKSHAQLMSLVKQGLLGALLLAVAIGTWLASRKRAAKRTPPQDDPDEHGMDLIDDLTGPAVNERTVHFDAAPDTSGRSAVLAVADNRPAEVAHVLSGWLNTKER